MYRLLYDLAVFWVADPHYLTLHMFQAPVRRGALSDHLSKPEIAGLINRLFECRFIEGIHKTRVPIPPEIRN